MWRESISSAEGDMEGFAPHDAHPSVPTLVLKTSFIFIL